jgi:hypothetical protein
MAPVLLLALLAPDQNDLTTPRAPSFLREIVPVFTRLGCNQGACHGKGAGQNGFRLSLRGYAPAQDHASITREFSGRRVSPAVPADSELVRKITGEAPHEGGKLVDKGGREYRVILDWITAGMPGPDVTEPALERISLDPLPGRGAPGDQWPLKVWAHWRDGQSQDVTWLARFASNNNAIASVTPEGVVKLEGPGETAIQVGFQSEVTVATVRVPHRGTHPATTGAVPSDHPVDRPIARQLEALGIPLSGLAEDATWLRRVCLDLTGRLPTPEQVNAFVADQDPGKYGRRVDMLLATPEFVDLWTLFLAELFQNRRERDHDVRGLAGVRSFHAWLREEVAASTPWDALARRILLATGSVSQDPAVGYWIVGVGESQAPTSEMPAMIAQAFLGTRVGCAQCHNHPTERYTQEDFLRQAAYLSRLKLDRKGPRQGDTSLVPLADPASKTGIQHPRDGVFLEPRPLDRSPGGPQPGNDPRAHLGAWVTAPGNPFFARAMANRIWRHLMGRGLVEPVDDLRATNPPANPELLDLLEQEFRASGYRFNHLIRLIATSQAYRRSAATLEANKHDERHHSHFLARRLPAEVLLDALCQATGVPEDFPGHPRGTRAVQLADPGLPSRFLTTFGRSERVTACACEKSAEVTLPQVLHLLNGDRLLEKIQHPAGVLATVSKGSGTPLQKADTLHRICLARPMDATGTRAFQEALAEPGAKPDEVLADLFWSLLNAKEFSFQH